MKKYLLFLLVLQGIQSLFGQQDAQFTQYMYNTQVVNSAYAGSRENLGITGLHRSQWVGLDGAPTSQTLSLSSPVSERIGLGFSFVNDEIGNGTIQDSFFQGVFAYHVPAGNATLSFGLSAGASFLNVNFANLSNYDASTAPVGSGDVYKKFSPTVGAGVYFHNEKFYVGFSAPSFLKTEHFDTDNSNDSSIYLENITWYGITGYVFDLGDKTKFKPATLVKLTNGAPIAIDVSANFMFHQKFILGGAYRINNALSGLAGFQLNEKLLMGLAYDKETSKLGGETFNHGSFEVFLRYEFIKKEKIDLTPRFF